MKNDFKVAKIVIQSPRIKTYVDVLASIILNYPNMETIYFVFINKVPDEEFTNSIINTLSQISNEDKIPSYSKALRLRHIHENKSLEDFQEWGKDCLVDVSAISKAWAVQLAALSIGTNIKVCQFEFEKYNDKAKVEIDKSAYIDLLDKRSIQKIRKDYVAKKLLTVFLAVFAIIIVFITFVTILYPVIDDKILNAFNTAVGLGGLYLAYRALKL